VKADTYVVETTVHFPTELNLMWDSGRKCVAIIGHILGKCRLQDWREWRAWRNKLKRHYRASAEIHRKGGRCYRERLQSQVRGYLEVSRKIRRYVAFGVVAYNLQKLGQLLLEKRKASSVRSSKRAA
jgi:hypothetical protein